jgi:hypothetical protein
MPPVDTRLTLPRHSLSRAGGLLLMTCLGVAATELHAQAALAAEPSAKECPDLTGTYESRGTKWIDRYHLSATGTVRPTSQTRQLATFQRRGGGFTLIWHMPRQDVLAAARLQAQRDPRKYGAWLDMVLRDPALPLPLGMSEQSWFNQLAMRGPVFRVDVVLPLKQCKGGWFLVGGDSPGGAAEVEGGMEGMRDAELWLARDREGSLSLKWEEHRTNGRPRPSPTSPRSVRKSCRRASVLPGSSRSARSPATARRCSSSA